MTTPLISRSQPSFLDDPDKPQRKPRKVDPESLAAESALLGDYESFLAHPFYIEQVMMANEQIAWIEKQLIDSKLTEMKREVFQAQKEMLEDIQNGCFARESFRRAVKRIRARDKFVSTRKALLAEAQARLDSACGQE